jgi:hypothetical protein
MSPEINNMTVIISSRLSEPDEREVDLSGDQQDGGTCSGDINFHLVGFTVAGRVVRGGGNDDKKWEAGPAGLHLGLYTAADQLLADARTDTAGRYAFRAVKPGILFFLKNKYLKIYKKL